jgi:predicted PurR-regulated permease PerM
MKNSLAESPARFLPVAFVLLGLLLILVAIRILLVPIVAAFFVVYLFDPGVMMLQRRGLQRGTAFLLLLVVTAIAVGFILAFLPAWLRLESIGGSSQTFAQRFGEQLEGIEQTFNRRFPMIESINISAGINSRAVDAGMRLFQDLPGLVTTFLVNLLLVPFISYFMIRDGKTLKRRLVELVPNRYFEMSLIMMDRIDKQLGGYLRGRLIECILVGISQALFMGLAALFVPQRYILLIAAVCGVTNMIPYLGPVLGAIFGALLYLGSGLPMTSVYGLIAAAAAAHLVDNLLIAPAVLSHNVDLHPLTVALVLVIGGELLGTLGLLIAIPVASTIKVVVQEFYANYQAQVRT